MPIWHFLADLLPWGSRQISPLWVLFQSVQFLGPMQVWQHEERPPPSPRHTGLSHHWRWILEGNERRTQVPSHLMDPTLSLLSSTSHPSFWPNVRSIDDGLHSQPQRPGISKVQPTGQIWVWFVCLFVFNKVYWNTGMFICLWTIGAASALNRQD